jgi:hypothetical protein
VDTYNVYRSVPGLVVDFPNALQVGDALRLAVVSPDIQTVTFTGTSAEDFADDINAQVRGLKASASTDGASVALRLTGGRGRIKFFKSPGLANLGLAPKIVVPRLEFSLVGSVSGTLDPQEDTINFSDETGDILDTYRVTSVTSGVESLPSASFSPQIIGADLCVVEARFITPNGRPIEGVSTRAKLAYPDGSGVGDSIIEVYSDVYGRVALPLLQGHQYILAIPAIGYNETIDVPKTRWLDLSTWPATLKALFSPFGDVP